MLMWKRGSNGNQGNLGNQGNQRSQNRGLTGTSIFARTAEDQTRLNQARVAIKQAFDELLVNQQVTEMMLPLPPGRPEAFLAGWGGICNALMARLNWLLYDVQLGRMSPEDALAEADALIMNALVALRPGAVLHPRPRRQLRYAPVSAFVQVSRYFDIVSGLADYLSGLAQPAPQTPRGAGSFSPYAA